jgi:hypothetical protein
VTAGEIDEVLDYIGLLSEMCDDFDMIQKRKNFVLNPDVPVHLTLLYGLNCHAHYMVRRCLPLLAESTIAAVPSHRALGVRVRCHGAVVAVVSWIGGQPHGGVSSTNGGTDEGSQQI